MKRLKWVERGLYLSLLVAGLIAGGNLLLRCGNCDIIGDTLYCVDCVN